MARTAIAGTLITQIRERADMVNSQFVTDTEILRYLDLSYTWLYAELVRTGLAYFESTQTVNTDGLTSDFALPADYMATKGVDFEQSTNDFYEIPEYMFTERNDFNFNSTGYAHGYRIVGTNIRLLPTPTANQTYRHIYVPVAGTLDDVDDSIDGVSGWEELLIIDAAIKCLIKEESSTTQLERQREVMIRRLQDEAELRALHTPRRVVDVDIYRHDPWYRDRYRWGI